MKYLVSKKFANNYRDYSLIKIREKGTKTLDMYFGIKFSLSQSRNIILLTELFT